jgi:hypothetical protein
VAPYLRQVLPAPQWLRTLRRSLRKRALEQRLPGYARELIRSDERGALRADPGAEACIHAGLEWLLLAQRSSSTRDGGVARHFSLVNGWGASYPETSGYIVPTLIREGIAQGDNRLLDSARRVLDWLLSIQFPQGGFQGGMVGEEPRVPVTFNTGQILLGLAAGARHFGDPRYLEAMHRAAAWLAATQDADGCWRRFGTPFAAPGEKVYETHVAWGLFEADRVDPSRGYGEAGARQVSWALGWQHANGWFEKCCLSDPARPLTHTIGYVLRGLLEAHAWRASATILQACERTARALLGCIDSDGRLPARFDQHWHAAAPFVCVTGSAQVAHCWLTLYELTADPEYLSAALRANRFVRRTIPQDGRVEIAGAVPGSYPINGDYGQYQFLNWAVKFMIDASRKELTPGGPAAARSPPRPR